DLLATHPRIDRERVVLMGFSHGGATTLHATYTRFQHDRISRRPIRLFHGAADDYTPIAPCHAWVARAKVAGADASITEYPLVYHAFDNPRLPPAFRNHNGLNPSRCFFA